MIGNLNQKLNIFLNNKKLSKEEFDDLKSIAQMTNFNKDILNWFRIASSKNIVGTSIRHSMPNSIMVYTPTMFERVQVDSGYKFETDPLAIIFPKRDIQGL